MAIKFNAPLTEINRLNRVATCLHKLQNLYDETVKQLAHYAETVGANTLKDGRAFAFPAGRNKASKILETFKNNCLTLLSNGIEREWNAANADNTAMLDRILANSGLPTPNIAKYKEPNNEALNALKRLPGVSEKLDNYIAALKVNVELLCDIILDSEEYVGAFIRNKNLLENPDRFYTILRQKHGVAFVNKAGVANPGQGIDRNQQKNIEKLFVFEMINAYRKADYLARQNMPFIVGQSITRAHQYTDCPRCNAMQGNYPPDFLHVVHHVGCNCYSVPIFLTKSEMKTFIEAAKNGKKYRGVSVNKIDDVPDSAKAWWTANKHRFNKNNYPLFIKNNSQYFGKKVSLIEI